MITIHFGEGVLQRSLRAFGRKAFPPALAAKRPAQLKSGPARGIHEANSSDYGAGTFFFDRPDAIATKIPVTHERGHLAPYFHLGHRPAVAEETHDFGIRANLTELLKILFAKPTQQQSLSF